jgi:hypothetical protein
MKRGERQPKWIPNAVWNAYQKCEEYFAWAESNNAWIESSDIDTPSRQDLETFRKLVFDKGCERIWPIVVSRIDAPSLSEFDYSRAAPWHLFLWTLRQALTGPAASSLMPANERKDRGEKVAKLARQLGRELQFIAGKGDIPRCLSGPLAIHLESTCEAYTDHEPDTDDSSMMEFDEGPQFISLVVEDLFFQGDRSIFGVLAEFAEMWAKTAPIEYRTDDTKAKRNYFVREMTRYFNVNFHQPHRQAVVCITKCLLGLEVSDLDVTRIAPVGRRGNPA